MQLMGKVEALPMPLFFFLRSCSIQPILSPRYIGYFVVVFLLLFP